MDKKGLAYNDDEWQRGKAQKVMHNYIKEHLLYESRSKWSPTPSYIHNPDSQRIFPQKYTGIVDSGATHLHLAPSAPHDPPNTSTSQISVVKSNGQV